MRFLIDNCLPPQWGTALDALCRSEGHEVYPLRDKFKPNVPDTEWLSKLAVDGGWTIISADRNITRVPQEREAWRASGLTAFFLAKDWGNHPVWEQHWRIVRWWPEIVKLAGKPGGTLGFLVPLNYSPSKLERFYTRLTGVGDRAGAVPGVTLPTGQI